MQYFISERSTDTGQQGYHVDIKGLLDKHSVVFSNLQQGISPNHGFQHVIELVDRKPVVANPYCHPKRFKDKIERTIQELLGAGHIQPSSSHFASSIVLVKKEDGTMRMCIDY